MGSAELEQRARRAYEIGRARWALQIAWIVIALLAISFAAVGPSLVSAATGALLLLTAATLRWRGGRFTDGVRAGLQAGAIPFALLLLVKCGALCSLGDCMAMCTRFCAVGGLAAGALLATRARDRDFLVAGTLVAALTGALGCFVGGAVGMLWMLAGELIATLPVVALQLRR
jgi:hypothetical protein